MSDDTLKAPDPSPSVLLMHAMCLRSPFSPSSLSCPVTYLPISLAFIFRDTASAEL